MKYEDIIDRKDFLASQLSIAEERLDNALHVAGSKLSDAITHYRELADVEAAFAPDKVETYFCLRCQHFAQEASSMAKCTLKNILQSTTPINHQFLTGLCNAQYVFRVLESRSVVGGFKVPVLADITNGEVALVDDSKDMDAESLRHSSTALSMPAYERGKVYTKHAAPSGSGSEPDSDYKNSKQKGEVILAKRLEAASIASSPSTLFGTLNTPTSSPVQSPPQSPALLFTKLQFEAPKENFLLKHFQKPFKVLISLSGMRKYSAVEKLKLTLDSLVPFLDVDTEDLMYFSSVDYYRRVGFSEVIQLWEVGVPVPDLERMIREFLGSLPEEKRVPVLSIILNVAPGVLFSLDFSEYRALPHFFLVVWAQRLREKS